MIVKKQLPGATHTRDQVIGVIRRHQILDHEPEFAHLGRERGACQVAQPPALVVVITARYLLGAADGCEDLVNRGARANWHNPPALRRRDNSKISMGAA